MELDVGYVVSDMVVTGPQRGTYKVWVPKKHGDPTGSQSYNGLGANLGNLGAYDFYRAQEVAEYYYPLMPLSSGGHMPFDPDSGLVSGTEINDKISLDTVPVVSQGDVTINSSTPHPEGEGATYKMRQTEVGMFQVHTPGPSKGETVNVKSNTPTGNYFNLSLGTKVVVCDNIILGQLPPNQNDLINQIRPLNQS